MSEGGKQSRTLAAIGSRYDQCREAILASIRQGQVSASMSGIDYYPKPWADLDMADYGDAMIVSAALTWDGTRHDYEGLKKA